MINQSKCDNMDFKAEYIIYLGRRKEVLLTIVNDKNCIFSYNYSNVYN